MSDRGKDNPPPSSRRTQRYQQTQEADPIKRNLVKGLVIGGGILATGGAGALLNFLRSSHPDSKSTPIRTRTPEATSIPLSPELQRYVDRLIVLNQEVDQNPHNFKEIAPKVGAIAIEYFCTQLGYDPKSYAGKIRYEWNDEYQKLGEAESGCIVRQNYDDEYGRVYADSDYLTVNLEKILYHDIKAKITQPYAVLALFATLIHELHHLTSPALPDTISNDPQAKIRGLGLLKPSPQFAKPGWTCYDVNRFQLEEAIVQDSTDRMVFETFGFSMELTQDYSQWVQRYRMGVIDRFFGGNNKPLLRLHLQSKPTEFFSLVGQKLGFPTDQAAKEGESYLVRLLIQGIF